MKRVVIYPKDIIRITGRSEKYARKLLAEIKTKLKKEPKQFISVDEFCEFTGLKIEQVQSLIID
jgi:hypothetical protein